MRERDRQAIRQFLEAERAAEQRLEEKRMKPIHQAQEQVDATLRQIHSTIRERIQTQRDDAFVLDPETTKPIPTVQVPNWQRSEGERFKAENPDWWPTAGNERTLVDYINRNHPGIKLVSSRQLGEAFRRLREYSLLEEWPAAEPPLELRPIPHPEPVSPPETELHEGVDPQTGLNRQYTSREVDRMTSDTFRRSFQLVGDKQPRFVDARFA